MRIALAGAELEESLALRYLKGALERSGHAVEIIAFNGRVETERAAGRLAASGADLAGLSMVFTYRAREFAALARRSRALGYRGHLTAGGHFAAFNAEALLEEVTALDSAVRGEGEEVLVQLASHLGDLGEVEGLLWRDPSGKIVSNAPAAKPPDLDRLPFPARRRPFDRYLGIPIANVLSSRGCAHACAFCSIAAWHRLCGGERFRLRDPSRVAEEMAGLWREGVRIFNFHDDNFFLKDASETRERMGRLRDELARRGVGKIAFAVKARPDAVDEVLLAFLKSMGLFRVFLGIEAGTEESLRRLGRRQSLPDNERALSVLHRLDLHACFNLLLLNPDSTLGDFSANVAFLRRHPKNPMNFCRTEVYAGTPLEGMLRREGRLLGDMWGYDYRIADPRAQTAFEVIYSTFEGRSYGEECLHHTVMSVDYNHQLLAHFFGTEPDLRARVKDFIVEVNRNTCSHLEEVASAAGRGLPDAVARRSFEGTLVGRLREDNRRLTAAAMGLLEEIRSAAALAEGLSRRRWLRRTAAAGLAATALLGGSCAREKNGQPTLTQGDPSIIEEEFLKKALPFLREKVKPPRDLHAAFQVDGTGKVSRSEVSVEGLPDDARKEIQDFLDSLTFQTAEARGKLFVIQVHASQLEDGAPPPPPEPPPRHFETEMAPVPPKKEE